MNFENEVLVTFVRNPWEPYTSRVVSAVPFVPGKSIMDYSVDAGEVPVGYEIVASLNGKVVDDVEQVVLCPGCGIVFCAIPMGGDSGKQILRIVAAIVVTVIAYVYGGPLGGAVGNAFGATWSAGTAAIVGGSMIAVAGGILINVALPMQSGKVSGLLDGDWAKSNNYGWSNPTNALEEGVVLPSLIGTRRFAPPLLRWYRYMAEDEFSQQRIRLQYALADDLLKPITEEDIFINGDPIISFYSKDYVVDAVEDTEYSIIVTLPENKTVILNWGDGSPEVTLDEPMQSVSVLHTYASTDTFILTISGNYKDMEIDTNTLPVTEEKQSTAAFHQTLGDDSETYSCPWFNDSIVENAFPAVEIKDSTRSFEAKYKFSGGSRVLYNFVVTRTTGQPSTMLFLEFFFGKGLYSIVDDTTHRGYTADWRDMGTRTKKVPCYDYFIKVRYRKVGTEPWTTIDLPKVAPPTTFETPFRVAYSITDLELSNYEIQYMGDYLDIDERAYGSIILEKLCGYTSITGAQTFSTNGSDVTKVGLGLIMPNGIYHLKTDGTKENHSITVNVDARAYGTTPWLYSKTKTFSDATASALRAIVVFENLPPDKYELRAYISGVVEEDIQYVAMLYAEFLQEGTNDIMIHRGVSVLSLEFLATEKLNSMPLVEVKATCDDYVENRLSTNPAWAAYYRLIDKHGVMAEDILFDEFESWAETCDAEGYKIGLYLDTQFNLHDVLGQIGMAGKASVIRRGTKWGVIQDAVATPVQMFSMENITMDSFEETFLSADEKANTILAWYFDEENDYRRTSIEVRDPSVNSLDAIKKVEVSLYGVTNKAQAVKIAVSLLNHTRLVNRTVSWLADVDAIACQVGDVVYFQHEVPMWGHAAGRVVSSTLNSVTIDRPSDYSGEIDGVSISTFTFKIFVRHQEPNTSGEYDSIEIFNIVNPYPNDDVVTYTLQSPAVWSRLPEKDSIVSIGRITGTEQSTGNIRTSVKKFRVLNIERYEDQTFKITALEYYDDAYETDYIVDLPAIESGLTKIDLVSADTGWHISGRVKHNCIHLTWFGNVAKYYILYRYKTSSGWSSWTIAGDTSKNHFDIYGLQTGLTYQFAVTMNVDNPLGGATIIIDYNEADTAIDPSTLPAVTNLRVVGGTDVFSGTSIEITWDEVAYFTFHAYKVEVRKTSDPTVLLRTELVTQNKFAYKLWMNILDNNWIPSVDIRFVVYMVDEYGNAGPGVFIDVSKSDTDEITGLQVKGGGVTFETRDLSVEWTPPATMPSFNRYVIEVRHGVTLKRTYYSISPTFDYTFEMNKTDGDGTPSPVIVIAVKVEDSFGAVTTGVSQAFTNYAPAAVTGLQVKGGGLVFNASDLEVEWTGPSPIPDDFERYRIDFDHGASTLRTIYTTELSTAYTYWMNTMDGGEAGPAGEVGVTVYTVDCFNQSSVAAEGTFTNPAPAPVSGLSGRAYMAGAEFTWYASTAKDFAYYEYKCTLDDSAWPTDWTRTNNQLFIRMLSADEAAAHDTIYFKIRVLDSMGNFSTEEATFVEVDQLYVEPTAIDDFADISAGFPRIPVVVGDTFTNNSPTTGKVSWNAHHLFYNGTDYSILAGETGVSANGDAIYIWWDNGANTYNSSTAGDHPSDLMGVGDFIIAVNTNGSVTMAWNSIANQVIGSAYIQKAAINDLHVNELSASKLTAGSVMTPGVKIGGVDTLSTPVAASLYITADSIGYWDGSAWQSLIKNDGTWKFGGDANAYIEWTGTQLNIKGSIVQSPAGTTFPVPCWRGAYDAGTTYYRGDVVYSSGTSWIYINTTSGAGHTPADDAYWDIYAQQGATGETGEAGAVGYNAATLTAYLRSATTPATTPGALTYTFSTASWTPGNSWSKTVPSGTDPVWAVAVTAYSNTDTDSILSTDWSAPVQVFANGETGASGLNVATAYLYQRTASSTAPTAMPTAALTFTFATGAITGTPGNSWTAAIPALDAAKPYLWVTTATASNTAATDSVAVGEWAASRLLSQDGAPGTAARVVSLTIGNPAIVYDVEGDRDTPLYTDATATALNTTGTVYYDFLKNGSSVQNTTSSSYRYYPPDLFTSMPETLEVNIREGASTGTILAKDKIVVFGVKAGANAITVGISNAAHVLPASSTGVVSSYAGSGTILSVWEGATQLSYSTSGNSTWNVVSAVGSSITVGTPSTVGQSRVYGDHSAMTADLATVTYTIAVRNSGGGTQTFTILQSLSKSKAGVAGVDGDDGATGAPGPGVVFRGDFTTWVSTTFYYTAQRRDVILRSGTYYLYNIPSTSSGNVESSYTSGDWTPFGATFSSVATGLLLAEDATITRNLTIGTDGTNYGSLRSVSKTGYGDSTAGFWFGYSSGYKMDIGNSTDYLRWTGSAVNIASSGADAIVISGGSGIRIASGGDIILTGATSDPGEVIFSGTSRSTRLFTILDGTTMQMEPSAAGYVNLYFGYSLKFNTITSYATNYGISGSTLIDLINGSNHVKFNSTGFYPDPTGTIDLGTTSYRWNDINANRIFLSGNTSTTSATAYIDSYDTSSTKFSLVCRNSTPENTFWVTGAGTAWLMGGVAVTSDEKYKTGIVEFSDKDGVQEIVGGKMGMIKPRRYVLNGTEDVTAGFLAQEIQNIIPEATKVLQHPPLIDKDGKELPGEEFLSLNIYPILPYMVQWIKEQQSYIDALVARVEALETKQLQAA